MRKNKWNPDDENDTLDDSQGNWEGFGEDNF
jgi:hypothetical protein